MSLNAETQYNMEREQVKNLISELHEQLLEIDSKIKVKPSWDHVYRILHIKMTLIKLLFGW
jgi:hypothetical protein